MTFEAGQVVQLKSGGPMMTIGSINDEERTASCLWFDDATLKKEALPLIALEAADLFIDVEDDDIEEDAYKEEE